MRLQNTLNRVRVSDKFSFRDLHGSFFIFLVERSIEFGMGHQVSKFLVVNQFKDNIEFD